MTGTVTEATRVPGCPHPVLPGDKILGEHRLDADPLCHGPSWAVPGGTAAWGPHSPAPRWARTSPSGSSLKEPSWDAGSSCWAALHGPGSKRGETSEHPAPQRAAPAGRPAPLLKGLGTLCDSRPSLAQPAPQSPCPPRTDWDVRDGDTGPLPWLGYLGGGPSAPEPPAAASSWRGPTSDLQPPRLCPWRRLPSH